MSETKKLESRENFLPSNDQRKSDIFFGMTYESFIKSMEDYGYQRGGYESENFGKRETIFYHPKFGIVFYAYFDVRGLKKIVFAGEVTHPDEMTEEYKKCYRRIQKMSWTGEHFQVENEWYYQFEAEYVRTDSLTFDHEIDGILSNINNIFIKLSYVQKWTKGHFFDDFNLHFLTSTEENLFLSHRDVAKKKIEKCNSDVKKIVNS